MYHLKRRPTILIARETTLKRRRIEHLSDTTDQGRTIPYIPHENASLPAMNDLGENSPVRYIETTLKYL